MVKFCDLLCRSFRKTVPQMVFLKKNLFDCFVVDSSRLHLTFEALYLLSVILKQYRYNYILRLPIRAPDQIPDRYYVISNGISVADVPPSETSLAARSKKKRIRRLELSGVDYVILHHGKGKKRDTCNLWYWQNVWSLGSSVHSQTCSKIFTSLLTLSDIRVFIEIFTNKSKRLLWSDIPLWYRLWQYELYPALSPPPP